MWLRYSSGQSWSTHESGGKTYNCALWRPVKVRSVQPREGTITTFRYVKHCLLQNSSNVFCVIRKPSTSERTLWESNVGLRRNKNVRISQVVQGWSCLPQAEWIPAIKGPDYGGQILLRSVVKSFKHWNQASDSVSLDFDSLCLFMPQIIYWAPLLASHHSRPWESSSKQDPCGSVLL